MLFYCAVLSVRYEFKLLPYRETEELTVSWNVFKVRTSCFAPPVPANVTLTRLHCCLAAAVQPHTGRLRARARRYVGVPRAPPLPHACRAARLPNHLVLVIAVPRLVTQESSSRSDALARRGLAFQVRCAADSAQAPSALRAFLIANHCARTFLHSLSTASTLRRRCVTAALSPRLCAGYLHLPPCLLFTGP